MKDDKFFDTWYFSMYIGLFRTINGNTSDTRAKSVIIYCKTDLLQFIPINPSHEMHRCAVLSDESDTIFQFAGYPIQFFTR